MKEKLSNSQNRYYGHGIGIYDENVVKSIFSNGLRCSHEQLYFTTVELGTGSPTLFEETQDMLNNWEHKGSKQIIIASLPNKYQLMDISGTGLYGKGQSAFYNNITAEEATNLNIAPGYYLKPEFIMGMYDTNTKSFLSNPKYYENLNKSQQDNLFNEVKKQYINLIKDSGFTFAEYSEILEEHHKENPLCKEEIEREDQNLQMELLTKSVKQSNIDSIEQMLIKNVKENREKNELEEVVEEKDDEWGIDEWE